MDIQYKPSKPKKTKPPKAPKAPKAEKAVKFNSTAKAVKPAKPAKAPKAPKPEKAKALSFGKVGKIQADKPVKMEKAKKPGIFSKVDPRLLLGGALVLIAAIAVVVLTVVLPAIEEHGQQIKGIEVANLPKKVSYLVGEEADYAGLKILVTRNNGETFTVRANKCQITGFDSSEPKQMIITVTYEGFTTDFSLKVEALEISVPIVEIEMFALPKKLSYTLSELKEGIDTDGGVILCKYQDGSTAKAMLLYNNVSGYESITTKGKYDLTVCYIENGVTYTTSFTINVTG